MKRLLRRVAPWALATAALPALAGAAAAAADPLDPAGALLSGKEKQPGFGRTAVTLHLAPDGTAAGSFLDPQALAIAWAGTWSLAGGTLAVDLAPVIGIGDPIACDLRLTRKRAIGTVTRLGATPVATRVKLSVDHPPVRPKGWTAIVPYLRDTGGTAAGDVRGTLLVRRIGPRGKRPMKVTVRAIGDHGMPGAPLEVSLPADGLARFEGFTLPALPPGVDRDAFQFVVTGKRGFDPDRVEIVAYEEVLRGPAEPATSGTPVPVHWVRKLKRKELAARETAPLLAPWFLDDDGAGALPRETRLAIRDLAPFTGDAPAGQVRVSVRTLAGAEAASGLVDLPRGAVAEVRPLDLLALPGDLPGGEGQVRVTAADGSDLPRGSVAAVLSSTVRQASVPVAAAASPLASPEPPGRMARIAFPHVLAPDDGSASARLRVLSVAGGTLSVEVGALDGTLLHSASVPAGQGATVRVDPEALGMDLSTIPGGECQVTVGAGPGVGLPTHQFLAQAEGREAGSPDTFFASPAGFESAHADGDPARLDLLDARETLGSDPGDRDASFVVRNGGAADALLSLRAFDETGVPLIVGASAPVTVPAGRSLVLSVEQALALLGVPVDGSLDYRGCLTLEGVAGGPLSALAIQYKRSVNATGGFALPVGIR